MTPCPRRRRRCLPRRAPAPPAAWAPSALGRIAPAVAVALAIVVAGMSPARAQSDPRQVPQEVVDLEAKLIEASGLALQGDVDEAVALYRDLLADDPANAAAAYSAARLLADRDEDAALKLMQQAHRHDPDNAYVTQALAELLADGGRHLQAADAYAELFARFPARESFLLRQTQQLAQGGKPREGLRAIEKHVAQGGRLTPYLGQQRFTLAVSMNDPKAAVRALEELIEAYPRNPEYYQELAQFYRRSDDEAAAQSVWRQMAERFPDDPRARLGLAGQSALTGEEEAFLARLGPIFADPAVELDAKIQQMLPIVKEVADRGDTVLAQRALPLAETLVDVHGDDPKSHALLADLQLYGGDTEAAIASYRATLERDPGVYRVWEQLLRGLAEVGDGEDLLAESDNALLMFPNQARLYYFNAVALARTGDLAAAENTLLQGTVTALDDEVLLYDLHEALARVQLRQGRYADALASAGRALEVRPKHGPALALRAESLMRADAERDEARRLLSQAVKEAPQHPYVLTVEAYAAVLDAEIAKAEGYVAAAMRYGADTWPLAHEVSGDIAFLRGDVAAAKAAWERARALGGGSDKLAEKLATGAYVK